MFRKMDFANLDRFTPSSQNNFEASFLSGCRKAGPPYRKARLDAQEFKRLRWVSIARELSE